MPSIVTGNLCQIAGNIGDLYLEPGLAITDGDTQNIYYLVEGDSTKWSLKLIVYCGVCCPPDPQDPNSYVLNIYRDTQYQWVETFIKSSSSYNRTTGPYNATNVSQPVSTTSKVWRGDLLGQNWQYLGTGSVN